MFNIGDKLTKKNYADGAVWCNENNCSINPNTWEIEKILPPTEQELIAQKRAERNHLLQQSDIKMLVDYPISSEDKESWMLYRQYLRDITIDDNFPHIDILSYEKWHKKEE